MILQRVAKHGNAGSVHGLFRGEMMSSILVPEERQETSHQTLSDRAIFSPRGGRRFDKSDDAFRVTARSAGLRSAHQL